MLFRIDELKGINNVGDSRRRVMAEFSKDGNAVMLSGDLKSCVNFRIGIDRIANVRNGQTTKLTGSDILSLWTNRACNLCLFTDGANLKKLNADFTATTLSSGLASKKRMMFEEHNNKVFMGNTEQMLKYVDGTVSSWGDSADMSSEFETPQRIYRTPNLSNILLSYRSRMYVAEGRYAFYSESLLPEKFRRSQYLTAVEDITAMSCDFNTVYLHGLNTTTAFRGTDPDNFELIEPQGIGAVKHGVIKPLDYPMPIILSKRGWAYCEGGAVKYLNNENFRLDLPDTTEAYLGYDPINKEVLCSLRT